MVDWEYSSDALNAKPAFSRVNTIIYVEGDDDILFWNEIFSRIPNFSFEIEPRGGSPELDKYIELIEKGELNAIAARDSDYLRFTANLSSSPKVVYTLGYSIENTLYIRPALHTLTKLWSKNPAFPIKACESWLREFSSNFETLLAYDIANCKIAAGTKVLHDNCTQFMTGKNSPNPCSKKIQSRIESIQNEIPAKALEEVRTEVTKVTSNVLLSIRGHFLASGVSKFISKQTGGASLSGDGLYTSAITYFVGHFNKDHPHFNYYMNAALQATQ